MRGRRIRQFGIVTGSRNRGIVVPSPGIEAEYDDRFNGCTGTGGRACAGTRDRAEPVAAGDCCASAGLRANEHTCRRACGSALAGSQDFERGNAVWL